MNAEQAAWQQIERLNADPLVQQLCGQWLNFWKGHDPRVEQLSAGARTPFEAYVRVLGTVSPATLLEDIDCVVELQDREYGPVPAVRDAAQAAPAQAAGDVDWAREFPPEAMLKAFRGLPEWARTRQNATSPQTEAIARRDLAKLGLAPLPGLTAGQTEVAFLALLSEHPNKGLRSGDLRSYDSLARRLQGILGDGEALRHAAREVKRLHNDDRILHRIAEKNAAAEAEQAKHRARPVENPTYHPKKIPREAIRPKEKPPDKTRDEVARQLARQKAGWELPEKGRRPEPLRKTISNKLEFDVACALAKSKGQDYGRVVSSLSPHFHKQLVGEMRERGLEPATAASSSGNSSSRHWVPAPRSSVSSESYPSGGGYSEGGSGEATSAAPDSTGTGQ